MKVIDNLEEFVNKFDQAKKVNPLDLSSDQDLSIGIMNLISIEEHLFFSGAKTHDSSFYDMINVIREDRKVLLGKIIKKYKGEVWCISKHLLAGCMRLMEVGTKALGADKREEAYDFFEKAYSLYCLFWALNMNVMDEHEVKEAIDSVDKNTSLRIEADNEQQPMPLNGPSELEDLKQDKVGFLDKVKQFVSKAVNCCRE